MLKCPIISQLRIKLFWSIYLSIVWSYISRMWTEFEFKSILRFLPLPCPLSNRGIFFFVCMVEILLKEKFHYIPWQIDLLYLRIKLPPASLKFKIIIKKKSRFELQNFKKATEGHKLTSHKRILINYRKKYHVPNVIRDWKPLMKEKLHNLCVYLNVYSVNFF